MKETVLKVRKKGITIIPKSLREAVGIEEGSEVKARVTPSGLLLRPKVSDPIGILENLGRGRKESAVTSIRRLRKRVDKELRG